MSEITNKITASINLTEYRKTGNYNHIINLVTPGFLELDDDTRLAVIKAFQLTEYRGDHHYTIEISDGSKVYVCENGKGYTAMLPSEY